MTFEFQVTFDAQDPRTLGRYWATVLDYVEEPPPDGHDSWDAFLDAVGIPPDEHDRAYAIVDANGRGPRVHFQKVPDGTRTKNRVHLDVNVGGGSRASIDERRAKIDARVTELATLGAVEVAHIEEHGDYWTVMRDPEGNEFCLV